MTTLQEAFSYASYMDVTELRQLYYGRNNLYVSFTDSIYYIKSGKESGTLVRPWSIVAHGVNNVVARKVTTPYFYANVLRIDKKGWVEDIRQYGSDQLAKDIVKLKNMKFLDESLVDTIVKYVTDRRATLKKFDTMWDITKRLSKNDEMLWNKILLELGYTGFTDQTGTGTFGGREPCSLILTEGIVTYLDTVPIQKYREDRRSRIKDRISQVQRLTNSNVKKRRVAKIQNRRR